MTGYIINKYGRVEFPKEHNIGSATESGIPVSRDYHGEIDKSKLETKIFRDAKHYDWDIQVRHRGICPICGNKFEPKGRQKYCSENCKNKAHVIKRREVNKQKKKEKPDKRLKSSYKNW